MSPFKSDLRGVEGSYTVNVRVLNLICYVDAHELETDRHMRIVRFHKNSEKRLKKAEHGGGRMNRILRLKNDSVGDEVQWRKEAGELLPPESDNPIAERSGVVTSNSY